MIELQGECGTCCSGRSTDYLVVSKSHRHCVRKFWAGHKCSVVGARGDCVRCVAGSIKDSDVAAGLSFAADFAGAGPQSRRVAEEVRLRECLSQQLAARSGRLKFAGPALGDSLELSQPFSQVVGGF